MSAGTLSGIAAIITALSSLILGVLQVTLLRRPPSTSDDSAPRSPSLPLSSLALP